MGIRPLDILFKRGVYNFRVPVVGRASSNKQEIKLLREQELVVLTSGTILNQFVSHVLYKLAVCDIHNCVPNSILFPQGLQKAQSRWMIKPSLAYCYSSAILIYLHWFSNQPRSTP